MAFWLQDFAVLLDLVGMTQNIMAFPQEDHGSRTCREALDCLLEVSGRHDYAEGAVSIKSRGWSFVYVLSMYVVAAIAQLSCELHMLTHQNAMLILSEVAGFASRLNR